MSLKWAFIELSSMFGSPETSISNYNIFWQDFGQNCIKDADVSKNYADQIDKFCTSRNYILRDTSMPIFKSLAHSYQKLNRGGGGVFFTPHPVKPTYIEKPVRNRVNKIILLRSFKFMIEEMFKSKA